MTYGTYTQTESTVFTVTHARHIAIKIGTDLKRIQRFYGKPDDHEIDQYEKEAIVLLKEDFMTRIAYGFKKGGEWRLALQYEARTGGILIADNTPGRIPLNVDIRGCHFTSFLVTNYKWDRLSEEEQKEIYKVAGIEFWRELGEEPNSKDWRYDYKTYSAGGRGVIRKSIRG